MQQEIHFQTEADDAHQVEKYLLSSLRAPNINLKDYSHPQNAHRREAFLLSSLSPQKRPYEQSERAHSEESRDVLAGGRETDRHLGQDRGGAHQRGRSGHFGIKNCSGRHRHCCRPGVIAGAIPPSEFLKLTGFTDYLVLSSNLLLLCNSFIFAVN